MIMNQPARRMKAVLCNKFVMQGRLFFLLLIFSFSSPVIAQQAITGKVTGNSNPLSGVTVQVKGNTVSTQTDVSGSFAISASPDATLVFTSVGYATKEVPVSNRAVVDVELEAVSRQLDQVVVTGYTRQAKKDITGSVAVVDVTALKSIPSGSAEQALQGQASGVVVINSGVPGGTSNIFIRGVSSFGDTQPLVIVDGVQSSLHDVNSNDIESIQVLKDAGAAAIYGVRGSNGVIIVTTKKGRRGAPTLSYDFYYGTQVPPPGNVLNIASPEAYAAFAKKMDPGTQLFPDGTLPDY